MSNVIRLAARRPRRKIDYVRLWEGRVPNDEFFGVDFVFADGTHITMGHWPDYESGRWHAESLARDQSVAIRELRS